MLALLLVEYLVSAAIHDSRHVLGIAPDERDAFVMLLGNAVIFVVLMHAKDMSYRDLLHPSSSSIASTAVLIVPLVALLMPALLLIAGATTELLESLLPLSRWEEQAFDRMMSGSLPAIVATCLLAPVLEEMLFRGIILRAFLLQYPRWAAIWSSALIFGFAHMNVYQFVVASMIGVLLGWLYERTRSLIPCIALHGLYNAAATVSSATARAGDVAFGANAEEWVLAGMAATASMAMLLRLLRPSRASRRDDASAP
ncbi:CPBP family intramembrane glutamic endopeptidase [Hydrogenophaga sp.]|uniref:CPBP family intramembrane glutamic endopeptidase n=1 Tax=Hydrogenophaga sp. TaxID=1904254 RepID=UPI002FCBF7A5